MTFWITGWTGWKSEGVKSEESLHEDPEPKGRKERRDQAYCELGERRGVEKLRKKKKEEGS